VKAWLAALLLAVTGLAQADIYRFALIGDVPYSARERRELPRMLEAIANSQVDLIAHIGDIKSGGDRCDDGVFEDRYRLFNAARVPFVFVPGDNEWTDCERQSNGAYDPLERLGKLRSLFWPDAYSLGQRKIRLEQQPGSYPEHARFRLGPVLFVTLNIPGGNNYGLAGEPSAEFLARNPVVLNWLKDSFALARQEKLAGIVLLFQADPSFKHFTNGFTHRAFRDFLAALRQETINFPGQVVAVHGDSHISRIDQPLRNGQGKILANFTRVETFGYPIMGWTRGIIDTDAPGLFRFESHAWEGSRH
jgi:hypothetical protein